MCLDATGSYRDVTYMQHVWQFSSEAGFDMFGNAIRSERSLSKIFCEGAQTLPNALCITFDARYTTNGTMRRWKDMHCVHIPQGLRFTLNNCSYEYELCGMVLHKGDRECIDGQQVNSVTSGHYTSLVRRAGLWYNCDDDYVSKVNNIQSRLCEEDTQCNIYVAVYELVKYTKKSTHLQLRVESSGTENKDDSHCNRVRKQSGYSAVQVGAAGQPSEVQEPCGNDEFGLGEEREHAPSDSDQDSNAVSIEMLENDVFVQISANDEIDIQDALDQSAMDVTPSVMSSNTSVAPQAKREAMLELLARKLRDKPTAPPSIYDATKPWDDVDNGEKWPMKHCAFSGCRWESNSSGWKSEFISHLELEHNADFQHAQHVSGMQESSATLRTYELYNEV